MKATVQEHERTKKHADEDGSDTRAGRHLLLDAALGQQVLEHVLRRRVVAQVKLSGQNLLLLGRQVAATAL